MAVFFNMLTRVIWVIDPLYHNKLACPPTGQRDEIIAWKLHDALFTCLNEFYTGWQTSKDNWTLKFPSMTDCIFSRADTGGCVLHVARHFDAHKLKMPLTKTQQEHSGAAQKRTVSVWLGSRERAAARRSGATHARQAAASKAAAW